MNDDFWITNISKMNVSLRDLNITIKARSHVNLLNKRHYSYTLEQLKKSAKSGSIFKKRDKIKVRQVPPEFLTGNKIMSSSDPMDRIRNPLFSRVEIKEAKFEELVDSEEELAESIADHIVQLDND